MTIEVRLFGGLERRVGGSRSVIPLTLPRNATVAHALFTLGIPANEVHIALVNGRQEADFGSRLSEGCRLTLFPPLAGG